MKNLEKIYDPSQVEDRFIKNGWTMDIFMQK